MTDRPSQSWDGHAIETAQVGPEARSHTQPSRLQEIAVSWLLSIQQTQGLRYETVAAALRRCEHPEIRHALVGEIRARWGEQTLRRTLDAERTLVENERAPSFPRDPGPDGAPVQRQELAERDPPVAVGPAPPMNIFATGAAPAAPANLAPAPAPSTNLPAPSSSLAVESNAPHASTSTPATHAVAPASDVGAPATAIERATALAHLCTSHLAAMESVLLPAYRGAAAATDTPAVRAIVLQLIGGMAHVHNAQAEIVRLVPQTDTSPTAAPASTAQTDPFAPDPVSLARVRGAKIVLDHAVTALLSRLAVLVSPQMLGDEPIAPPIEPPPVQHAFERFVSEAELVMSLLDEADLIQAKVMPTDPTRGTSEPARDGARSDALDQLARWKGRPINFLFLVRVLTRRGVWQALQGVTSLRGDSAADLERKVSAQAVETGKTADVGTWDADAVRSTLGADGTSLFVSTDDAMAVVAHLAQVDERTRGLLVKQLHRMGLLARMCEKLPWGVVKQLWDSIYDPEASKLLEPYWVDRGGGESLGQMLDKRWYTRPVNTFMDVTTLGAKPRIDAAYEAREAGIISDEDYWRSVNNSIGHAALVGAAMVATGGIAGEFAEGVASGLGRASASVVGDAAAGSIGAASGHFVGDLYDQALNGKPGFDAAGEYAKTFAVGGLTAMVAAPVGLAAARYLPLAARTWAQQAAAAHPQLTGILEAARASGVGVATTVRMKVREFLEIMRGGPPPGLRLAYARAGASAIPSDVAAAPPSSEVVLAIRPMQDLNAPAPMQSDNAGPELVDVEHVSLADQVAEAFDDASRGITQAHVPDEAGSFAGPASKLGEGAPEVEALQARRTKREAGVVADEGQVMTDLHHIFPKAKALRPWFEERGIDVDDWCIEITSTEHQAQHILKWSDEIMKQLRDAEALKRATFRDPTAKLTASEILAEGKLFMTSRGIDASMPFKRYTR